MTHARLAEHRNAHARCTAGVKLGADPLAARLSVCAKLQVCYPQRTTSLGFSTTTGSSPGTPYSKSSSAAAPGTQPDAAGVCTEPRPGVLLPRAYPTPWPTPAAYYPLSKVKRSWQCSERFADPTCPAALAEHVTLCSLQCRLQAEAEWETCAFFGCHSSTAGHPPVLTDRCRSVFFGRSMHRHG